nr:alpha amylase C-terminal domain-containing protein [Thermococcus litoralis]
MAFFRGHDDEVLVIANNAPKDTDISLPPGKWKQVWPNGLFRK